MDYLSNLRDVKSVIASVLRDNLSCVQGSSMKYTKLGDEIDSQENLNDLIIDMLEGEKLNCELETFHAGSSSNDSDSLTESVSSVSDKGINSSGLNSFEDSELSSEDEVPTRLVITYHFSFDTEDSIENETEDIDESEQDNEFEDCSFCSDKDDELLEYSSVKNGSKNNLLDGSFGQNLGNCVENVCLVDYDSDQASNNSTMNVDTDSDASPTVCLGILESDTDCEENCEPISKYCGNPSTPSMRNGFIYYSSEVRLYQGKLRYDDSCPEKKTNFARKLFRKVFPTQKYVVNV